MASNIPSEDLCRLKAFVEMCSNSPHILHLPELTFFRDYLEGMGATIPAPSTDRNFTSTPPPPPPASEEKKEEPEPELESEESDVELDNTGVIEPETTEGPPMGDSEKVPSEEDMEAANGKRSEAMSAMVDGDLQKAVDLFTEAIIHNPGSAMLYAKRASILIKQKRVQAAIRDCDYAITLNPDSAAAYKFRGYANRLLGKWIEAAKDLRLACKLDFDEQSNEWLKEVQPNASKLEEHKRKYERKRQEKEINARKERVRKAQEEAKKAQEEQQAHGSTFPGEKPKGMPDISGLFKDPEIMAAMQDPEVAAAFKDVASNPSNIFKYQSNPKVSAIINKLIAKFGGGAGGMPGGAAGGMPGGMPGCFPGGFPGGMGVGQRGQVTFVKLVNNDKSQLCASLTAHNTEIISSNEVLQVKSSRSTHGRRK